MKRRRLWLLAVLTFSCLLPMRALAGGLFLTDRGARALGRGGAFVAGADDGQSLWYNPAGLAYTGRKHVLMDGTLSLFRASFERTTRDDVNRPQPKVDADPLPLPIPTLAFADSFGLRNFSFGAAVMAPNAVMLRWPETGGVTADGMVRAAPTRHSLISMQGSALANIAFGAAYSGIKGLSLGLGLHVIPSRFRASVYLSACDYGVLCQQPEQAEYEAPATVDLSLAVTAAPMLGVIYERGMLRIGASLLFFYDIKGTAKLETQLPSAPFFGPSDECGSNRERSENPRCAHVVGNEAEVRLAMPMIARLGIELRPDPNLRVETGLVYEGWSRQQDFRVTPRAVRIENALGLPSYEVGPIRMRRDMQDVYSLRLGAEYRIEGTPVSLRAGGLLEGSAFRSRTLTPLTLDSKKALLALGVSYALTERVTVDVLYAHLFIADRKVRDSVVLPQNPLRPPLPADPSDPVGTPEPVGNGNYTMEADLLGLGLRVQL